MADAPLRIRRIMDAASERGLLLSFTSGMHLGRIPGVEDVAELVGSFATGGLLTGAVVHAGVLDSLFARFPGLGCGTIVDLFGGTWLHSMGDEQVCSLEHAVRVGADAVMSTVSLGTAGESRRLRITGDIARQCRGWGMPLVLQIDTSQTDGRRQYSATLAGHGARLAYELGADAVVVNYSGTPDTFGESLRGIDIPVLIGGSPNMDTDEALLDSIAQATTAGASGVCLPGEMFWGDGEPSPTLQKLHAQLFGSAVAL